MRIHCSEVPRGQNDELLESRRKREVQSASAEPRAPDRVTHSVPALLSQRQRTTIELRDRLCEHFARANETGTILGFIDW